MNDLDTAYDTWQKEQTPDNMAAVIGHLDPVIISEVHRYSGPKPLLRAKAKSLAVKAIQSYDPTQGAQLRSWVTTNLQPLSRYGQQLKPVRVSEIMTRQAAELDTQRKGFLEKHGHEPTDDELADHVGIPAKRIQFLRDRVKPSVTDSNFIDGSTGEAQPPAVTFTNPNDFATEAVYRDLDERERKIFDWKTGLHGVTLMENKDIAAKLGVTPALISQITRDLAERIQKVRSYAV